MRHTESPDVPGTTNEAALEKLKKDSRWNFARASPFRKRNSSINPSFSRAMAGLRSTIYPEEVPCSSLALFGFMLIFMVMRVGLPIGSKAEGQKVGEISLSFRERLIYHRTNVYAIGAVLLLMALAGKVTSPIEMVVILGTFAIVTLPGPLHRHHGGHRAEQRPLPALERVPGHVAGQAPPGAARADFGVAEHEAILHAGRHTSLM